MKIKWKCLLKRVVAPIVVTCVTAVLVVVAFIIGVMYVTSTIDPTIVNQNHTYMQTNYQVTSSTGYFPFMAILISILPMVLLVGVIMFIREASQPCLIKDTETTLDSIISGFSAIADLIQLLVAFIICIVGLVMGVAAIVFTLMLVAKLEIFMVIPIAIFTVLTFGCFHISNVIYPYHQKNTSESVEDDVK